ncbi:hypothetical protein IW261DRAFT_1559825 [Armillaria novae-zelandiae]|uniref:Uncharacterized protein n=1 Tax=Armillaria novae-zelandiae TaxID=153914 RepID=A0AA39PMS9_9AGAR|nr:hypothetical protein IW261DRAFT_1559825 [Armillaria novae-zelandiae]
MGKDLKPNDYEKLCQASQAFLSDSNFGHPEVENVMSMVFGSYQTRLDDPNAKAWSSYWTNLANYEEKRREGLTVSVPKIPAHADNRSLVMSTNMAPSLTSMQSINDNDGSALAIKDKSA